jgi:hypothetical protein
VRGPWEWGELQVDEGETGSCRLLERIGKGVGSKVEELARGGQGRNSVSRVGQGRSVGGLSQVASCEDVGGSER